MERRTLLSGTPVPLATAFAEGQAGESRFAALSLSPNVPTTVEASTQITAIVSNSLPVQLSCTDATSTAVVDGTVMATTFVPNPFDDPTGDTSAYVTLATGTHTVTFTILAAASAEAITQQTDSSGNVTGNTGPFVTAAGDLAGSIFTSALPFEITNSNHIAFLTQPGNVPVNTPFSPAVQVAVEDANNNIITSDNDTSISLFPDDYNPLELSGTSVATVVNGVATFTNLAFNTPEDSFLYADTQGVIFITGVNFPMASVGGLSAESRLVKTGAGGGGGSGAGMVPVINSTTVPSAVVAGTKLHSTLKLNLTNSGSTLEKGFTVNVYASADPTLDTSVDPLVTSVKSHATVRGGKSVRLNVSITKLPGNLSAGNYYLIVETVDSAGNTNSVATPSLVNVAAPVVSLTPVYSAAVTVARNGTATVSLTVTNQGNVPPIGTSEIQLFASTSPGVTGATPLLSKRVASPLKPGKSKMIKLQLTKAMVQTIQSVGTLVAEVTDPLGDSQTAVTVLA